MELEIKRSSNNGPRVGPTTKRLVRVMTCLVGQYHASKYRVYGYKILNCRGWSCVTSKVDLWR